MKGQLIPVVFIVLLVAGVIVGYIFYNIFYGTEYQFQVFRTHTIDIVRNLIEQFKNYLGLSLTYSSHQSLREHACLGGLVGGAGPWICNGPNPVDVDQSRDCLETYTKYYLNVYTNLFNTSLPIDLTKVNYTDCLYDVNRGDVFSKKYDEGNFWVNCSEPKIAVSGKNINEYEKILTDDFITKNRYWYMFRNFYDWANADVYSPCICSIIGCSCGSGSGEEFCSSCLDPVEDCAQIALENLQKRFDDDVVCDMTRECCNQGVGPPCGCPCLCLPWENTCMANCQHECIDPPEAANSCPVSDSFSLQGFQEENSKPFSRISAQSLNCVCDYWYEGRVAAGYRYRCQDFKYFVPSDKGPVPLSFIVEAFAFWRNPCACWSKNGCNCPEDAESCSECQDTCCTPCYGG